MNWLRLIKFTADQKYGRASERRTYHAGGQTFDSPAAAAAAFGLNRQSFYNRANSPKFPDWHVEIRKEVEC